jgi:hypothetical protein
VLGCVAAVGLSVVAPCVIPGALLAGGAAAAGGLAGNLLANALQKRLSRRENDPALPDVNHDLLRVIGEAVSAEIGQFARDASVDLGDQLRPVEALARRADEQFVDLFVSEELPGIAPPDPMRLLTRASTDEAIPPVGRFEDWQAVVRRLASRCTVVLTPDVESRIARRLHDRLWEAIRRALKRDFAADGKGYAALHLQFMGDVMARLDALAEPSNHPDRASELTRELLEALRAHKREQADPKAGQIIDGLSPPAKVRLSALVQRFDQLSARLDRHLAALLDEVRAADRASRGRDILTHRKLGWVLGGLTGLLAVLVVVYLSLSRSQSRSLTATTQIAATVDEVRSSIRAPAMTVLEFKPKSQDVGRYWKQLKYAFDRPEYVHPRIVHELAGWISDSSETVTSIDLTAANESNRFFGDVRQLTIGDAKWVRHDERDGGGWFAYRYVGTSPSGIHVLHCRESTGGSGVFNTVMFLVLGGEDALMQTAATPDGLAVRQRLTVTTLGTLPLGDRYEGEVTYDQDVLTIGADESPMPDRIRSSPQRLLIR